MAQRFFKLIYTLSLVALILSFPLYYISSFRSDLLYDITYKAKCISNGKFVVLEGAKENEIYEINKFTLDHPIAPEYDDKRLLNFYCKYYDEVQPYIIAYNKSTSRGEEVSVNQNFYTFQNVVITQVSLYPPLYELVIVKKELQQYQLYGPIIDWLLYAVSAFLLLQVMKICYVYVVFGRIVFHPFKSSSNKA